MIQFQDAIRLTADEGRAARILGLSEDACPYPISEHGRLMELRGYWLSGYAAARQIPVPTPTLFS